MRRFLGSLVLLAVVVGAWWAGRTTMTPPAQAGQTAAPTTYQIEDGKVGRLLSFSVSASWSQRLLAYNGSQGTVTGVSVGDGGAVSEGSRLYAVDERPVVVASGSIPAYRDLTSGDRGRDVAQLQRFLARSGYYRYTVDGEFDAGTVAAVRAWQDHEGVQVDGVVRAGDVVYVPHLPVRIQLADDIKVGRRLAPGSEAVYGLGSAPTFDVRLSADQSSLVPLDAAVVVHANGRSWRGHIESATNDATGDLVLHLAGRSGAAVCGEDCGRVPTGREATYPVDIVAVPTTRGPLVPAAGLQTDPSGSPYVTDVDGNHVRVTIVAADAGWSVVDGIDLGRTIMLFGGGAGGSDAGRD